MRGRGRVVLTTVVTAVVVVAAVAGVLWWLARPATPLAAAVALAPADAERMTWTDWSAVRAELGVDLDGSSTGEEVQELLDAGFETDLSSTSALLNSAVVMQQRFGFSPATLDWELLSQSAQGAVVVMGLGDDADVEAIGARLESLGYVPPEEDDGVWSGGADNLVRIGEGLTPELQYVVLDGDAGVAYASDASSYLADVTSGGSRGVDSVDAVVESVGEALSAAVYTGPHACAALAMGQADADDQDEADRLLADAGEVNPLTAYAMAAEPDGGIRVAMSFESDEQARTNADTRAVLAAGPAVGQGGDFADRFTVEQVGAEGSVVTLDLEPVEGAYVLSDLSSGPVLFATC